MGGEQDCSRPVLLVQSSEPQNNQELRRAEEFKTLEAAQTAEGALGVRLQVEWRLAATSHGSAFEL